VKCLDPVARRRAQWVAGTLAILFVLAAWVIDAPLVAELDHAARRLIREDRMLALKEPMRLISKLGSGDVLFPVTLGCSVLMWRRGARRLALTLPVIGVATSASLAAAKWLVDKPRPSLRDYGFPSGHVFGTTVFVIVAIYLLWCFDAPRRWQRAAQAAGAVLVSAVGYSRIYVDAHWLSDVVGGLMLGIAFALAVILLVDGRVAPHAR
jgi:membrane-associated phospholipid phosphatase